VTGIIPDNQKLTKKEARKNSRASFFVLCQNLNGKAVAAGIRNHPAADEAVAGHNHPDLHNLHVEEGVHDGPH
jgi:hypothetical protein